MIEGVVFDMDGVLVDTADLHTQAFAPVLAQVGIAAFDYEEIAGMRTPDAIRHLASKNGIPLEESTALALALEKRERFKVLSRTLPLMRGAVETIEAIRARGFRLGLASSGSPSSVRAFLDAAQVTFDVVLDGESVTAAKPAPEIYLLAAERLDIAPANILVVEDSRSGLQAARTAGTTCVAFRPSPALLAELPPSLEHVNELNAVLELLPER